MIVTEDLVDHRFVAERCEPASFARWATFVASEENSPEATESPHRRAGRASCAALLALYATGGNGAIYYGLGVTEHSQGSTMVMGLANLAMATGNIGRDGVGVNPLRGQNNVQGSCDMGSFPHELSGYRHVCDDADPRDVRGAVGHDDPSPSRACASRTCSTPPSTARSRGCSCRARTSPRVRPEHGSTSRPRCGRWSS